MTTFIGLIYITTVIGVVLPTLGEMINMEEVLMKTAPRVFSERAFSERRYPESTLTPTIA